MVWKTVQGHIYSSFIELISMCYSHLDIILDRVHKMIKSENGGLGGQADAIGMGWAIQGMVWGWKQGRL